MLNNKINRVPIKDPNSLEDKRVGADKTSIDRNLEKRVVNTLRSFFRTKVDTTSYSIAYKAVNKTFTLEDLRIKNDFTSVAELRDCYKKRSYII